MKVTLDATFTDSPDAVLLTFDPPLGLAHLKEFEERLRGQAFVATSFPTLSRPDGIRLNFVERLPMVFAAMLIERMVTLELGVVDFCLKMPPERDD